MSVSRYNPDLTKRPWLAALTVLIILSSCSNVGVDKQGLWPQDASKISSYRFWQAEYAVLASQYLDDPDTAELVAEFEGFWLGFELQPPGHRDAAPALALIDEAHSQIRQGESGWWDSAEVSVVQSRDSVDFHLISTRPEVNHSRFRRIEVKLHWPRAETQAMLDELAALPFAANQTREVEPRLFYTWEASAELDGGKLVEASGTRLFWFDRRDLLDYNIGPSW